MFKDSNSLKLLGLFWKIITYFTWHTTMLWKIKNVYRTFLSDLLTCDIFWCKGLNMAINVENKLLGSKLFALLSISFHLRKAELTIQQNHAYKMKTAKACIIFKFMFLSGHVRVSEWIHSNSCLNVKQLLAWSRHEIWSLSDCNWTRTPNHLVHKHSAVWVRVSSSKLGSSPVAVT